MTTAKTTKSLDTFKPVSKLRDMDKETYTYIEKICRECIEYPKERFKDENVK
ncbi:MAG: hypothetical protein MJ252_03900 [archaeon]|nr:hypothetical protein [archaeon]